MPKSLVTAGANPISLKEAKDHLRVSTNDDDLMIKNLITAATAQAENYTWRSLTTQTWDIFFDTFSDYEIPLGQLQSVTTIKYYDSDDVQQTLASTVYDVDINTDPGKISLAYGQSWPSVYDKPNAIEVRVVCGYTTTPEAIKSAIKVNVEMLYGNLFDNEHLQLKRTHEALLSPYRLVSFC